MKTQYSLAALALIAMAGLVGCESSPRGNVAAGNMVADDSFTLMVPRDVQMRQGAVQTLDVSIARGNLFKQDVKLDVKTSPGISVDPTKATIKASERPISQLKITVGKNAALGDYGVTVTAMPANGQATVAEFRVNVISQQ